MNIVESFDLLLHNTFTLPPPRVPDVNLLVT
jgi:hypothetical protein